MTATKHFVWYVGGTWSLAVDCFTSTGLRMDGIAAPAPESAEFRLVIGGTRVLREDSSPAISIQGQTVTLVVPEQSKSGVPLGTGDFELFVTDTSGGRDPQLKGTITINQTLRSQFP